MTAVNFVLPPALAAGQPPEARGLPRDGVRLLVGRRGDAVTHHRFTDLPSLLRAGDVLVVNTSATLPAAVPVPGADGLVAHFSTPYPYRSSTSAPDGWATDGSSTDGSSIGIAPRPVLSIDVAVVSASSVGGPSLPASSADRRWLVELRTKDGRAAHPGDGPGSRYPLPGGGALVLRAPYSVGRLWVADLRLDSPVPRGAPVAPAAPVDTAAPDGAPDRAGVADPVVAYLHRYGRPIHYSYVDGVWPLRYYQTVFASHAGSAEMPSAGRPFTDRLVTRLVSAGVRIAPVLLHAGVASPEAHERPYPERFAVPAGTARMASQARRDGGRVIAVGTTVVRALETAANPTGVVRPARGWTDLVVTPERGVWAVDGLITGLHEPRASHLDLVAAIAGRDLLARCYAEALEHGYLWHEFGDTNLLLP